MRISDWSSDVCSSDLHVYEHPYALLADVRVDRRIAPGADLTLSGVANWLACTDKICVPERAVIAVALKAGDGAIAPASRARFDAWRAKLPQPLARAGTWERKGAVQIGSASCRESVWQYV